MIGYLRAILDALRHVLENQHDAADQAAAIAAAAKADLDAQTVVLTSLLAAQAAAIEHLRVLIEESDPIPSTVNPPTFTGVPE